MTLDLETRSGLPEAMRILLAEYPREAWEADPNFSDSWRSGCKCMRDLGAVWP